MAPHRLRQRKIQENKNDVLYENVGAEGPPSGLRAEGGTHGNEMKKTSFIVFDMVALYRSRACDSRA
eukprot:1265647-Amphidinium_carterae.1